MAKDVHHFPLISLAQTELTGIVRRIPSRMLSKHDRDTRRWRDNINPITTGNDEMGRERVGERSPPPWRLITSSASTWMTTTTKIRKLIAITMRLQGCRSASLLSRTLPFAGRVDVVKKKVQKEITYDDALGRRINNRQKRTVSCLAEWVRSSCFRVATDWWHKIC